MAKSTTPDASAPIINPDATAARLAAIASAIAAEEAAKPVKSKPIPRAGLGKRGPSGNYCLRRLVISPADNIDVSGPGEPRVIDKARCRELCVPYHTEKNAYPSLIETEVVMEEHEDEFASEHARDAVLANQFDPHFVDEETGRQGRRMNLGPPDFKKMNAAGGKTWMGNKGLQMPVGGR